MKRNIFYPNWKLVILAVLLYIINVMIILSMVPVLESQTLGAKVANLIVFPPNFIFEDLFGISSVKSIDILTWILQFVYDYVIAAVLLYLVKGGKIK